jgi:6-phosphofructokinase 1
LKVTASSHHRAFLVEVMGRDCGYIALITGITGGAEAIVTPEVITDPEAVAREFRTAYERGKAHAIVVVAEGARYNAEGLAEYFQKHRSGVRAARNQARARPAGGAPGVFDRLLATRFGAAAIEQISQGHQGVLIGLVNGQIATTPLENVVENRKPLDLRLLDLATTLAR